MLHEKKNAREEDMYVCYWWVSALMIVLNEEHCMPWRKTLDCLRLNARTCQ